MKVPASEVDTLWRNLCRTWGFSKYTFCANCQQLRYCVKGFRKQKFLCKECFLKENHIWRT